MKELVQDPDAGGKLSTARTPLILLAIGLGLAWFGVGTIIAVSQWQAEGPLAWATFEGWFKVGTGSLWPLIAAYVGGKGVGKLPELRRG